MRGTSLLAWRLARPAAGLLAVAHWRQNATCNANGTTNNDGGIVDSQTVAQRHVAGLATSDGTPYTLDYLDGSRRFSVWRGTGERSSFSEMLTEAEASDVVHLGETHTDAIAHKLQEIIFARLAASRPCALSLEMFETDIQHVLDEYLAGLTREKDMLQDARPWGNYKSAYRVLVELAKEARMPVLAANAPRRYVGAVGRDRTTLHSRHWGARAYADLPPLPLPLPSEAYTAHLLADPEVVPRELAQGASDNGPQCPYIGLKSKDGLEAPMQARRACSLHARHARPPLNLLLEPVSPELWHPVLYSRVSCLAAVGRDDGALDLVLPRARPDAARCAPLR